MCGRYARKNYTSVLILRAAKIQNNRPIFAQVVRFCIVFTAKYFYYLGARVITGEKIMGRDLKNYPLNFRFDRETREMLLYLAKATPENNSSEVVRQLIRVAYKRLKQREDAAYIQN